VNPLLFKPAPLLLRRLVYTIPKAMDDFIVNNEKKKHSSYGMKSFIP
jgi:hypothetical protein